MYLPAEQILVHPCEMKWIVRHHVAVYHRTKSGFEFRNVNFDVHNIFQTLLAQAGSHLVVCLRQRAIEGVRHLDGND